MTNELGYGTVNDPQKSLSIPPVLHQINRSKVTDRSACPMAVAMDRDNPQLIASSCGTQLAADGGSSRVYVWSKIRASPWRGLQAMGLFGLTGSAALP